LPLYDLIKEVFFNLGVKDLVADFDLAYLGAFKVDDFKLCHNLTLLRPSALQLYAHPRGELKLSESADCLSGRLKNIKESLMGPNFELLTALLVYMGTTEHRITADARG
jgi:hypothetical protein